VARVLIAGCGDVGTALGLALAADGDEVVGLRRRPEALPREIRALRADLTTGHGLDAAARGAELVVYAAAADASSDDAYRSAYVDGLRNLLAALRAVRAPIRRVLFTSSTAVYAQRDGSWVDETSPTEPEGFSGRRTLEAESLLLGSGFPATVLRLGGIYGPGRTRLIDEVRSGRATCVAGESVYTNRIHVVDCAGAARHLLRLPAADGVWLGVDREPTERAVVLDWLADRLGVARPRRVAAAEGASRERGGSKRCRSAKLAGSGYSYFYPTFRDGYGELLAGRSASTPTA
jgi:nucleoside-diphosphate-sugar epimerase